MVAGKRRQWKPSSQTSWGEGRLKPACLLSSPEPACSEGPVWPCRGSGRGSQKLLSLRPRTYPLRSCTLGRSGSTRRWRRGRVPRSCCRNTVRRQGARMGPSWCGRARPSPTTTRCPSGKGMPPSPRSWPGRGPCGELCEPRPRPEPQTSFRDPCGAQVG